MNKIKRVIVIGIDGATWKLLDPWIAEGSLPNFARIVQEGISTNLTSTIPPMTAPAWTSFATGKNPGKHGVFDFFQKVNNQKQVIDSKAIKSKQIWDILSEQGKKVIVINPPLAYPVKKVNGYFIAGMMTPSYEVNYTYTPSLKNRLTKWGYQIGVDRDAGMRSNWARSFVMSKDKKKRQELIDFFNQIAINRWETFKKLSKKDNFDFAFILFEGTDRLQHYYWQKDDFYVIKNHYQALDKILGECLSFIEKDGALFVISDHGFDEIKEKFYINNFLAHHGLLRKRRINIVSQLILKGGKEAISKLAHLGIPQEKILTNRRIFKLYQKLYRPNIDLGASQAFMLNETSRGIWVDYKDDKDYEKTRNFIIKELNSLRDPRNGKRIIKAFRREEIYQGLHLEKAPNILLMTCSGYSLEVTIEEEDLKKIAFLKPTSLGERNADHEREGVLMIVGPGVRIKKKRTVKDSPKIIDIAPTILRFFGIHIPIDMDGEAIF